MLERYGVQGPDEVIALARAYRERTAAADQAAQQVRLARASLSERQARRENTHTDLFQFVHSFAPEVKDPVRLLRRPVPGPEPGGAGGGGRRPSGWRAAAV